VVKAAQRVALALAVVFVLVAVAASWTASRRLGIDFGYLYVTAVGTATGAPIYDPAWQATAMHDLVGLPPPKALGYPPSTGLVLLPFTLLPYTAAQTLWFIVLAASVLVGTVLLLRRLRPSLPMAVCLLAAGAVLFASCMRWSMTPLQGAPLLVGLLALMVLELHANRTWTVLLIALFALAFKFTLAIPFLGLLLLFRRFELIAGSVAIVGVMNVVGFLRVGGINAVHQYLTGMAGWEQLGTIDTPDPWDTQEIPRLDWTVLVDGVTRDVQLSHALGTVIAVLVALWLLKEFRWIGRPTSLSITAAFLAPLVLLSLESTYHHHYDACLMVIPIVIFIGGWRELRLGHQAGAVLLLAPFAMLITVLPIAGAQQVLLRAFGDLGLGLLNLGFPLATTLAMLGSLLILRQTVQRQGAGLSESQAAPIQGLALNVEQSFPASEPA
jgi:hypothetical protein